MCDQACPNIIIDCPTNSLDSASARKSADIALSYTKYQPLGSMAKKKGYAWLGRRTDPPNSIPIKLPPTSFRHPSYPLPASTRGGGRFA